jgi:hypothetical protein
MRPSFTVALLLGVGASCAATPGHADGLPGFYLGAAIGEATVRTSQGILGDTGYDFHFDQRHGAWKVTMGSRPIAPVGIEAGYIDFGNPTGSQSISGFGGLSQASARAVTLFGLGYLPIPVPFLDVYGKLGVARLHGAATEVPPAPLCSAGLPCAVSPFGVSNWSTNLALGAGAQAKFGQLALRAEYERIAASGGSPDILSLGVTWTF